MRSELVAQLNDDGGDLLLSLSLDCFDEDFDLCHGPIVNTKKLQAVELDDRLASVIKGIQAEHPLSTNQCASLVLDVLRILILNGDRMTR